ncbi:hypothetical protein Tco_0987926 [Tanacetum coccineum]
MQAAHDRQKSYADLKRKPMEFQVGDRVMIKVSPWKGVIRFGKQGKLNPRYVRPFKVLKTKCYSDEPLAVPLEGLHIDDKLQFMEEPIEIMEREIKRLKRSCIPLIKVHWNSRRGPKFTWEHTIMSSDLASSEEPESSEAPLASPDYVPGPEEPEQAPLLPDYMTGPEYPKYLAPSDEEVPMEDQPYAVADSTIALSPSYVADSDPEKDLEEDSEDGPINYPTDRDDDDDDDSSDDDEEEEKALEEEEDEHLAPTNSVVAPIVNHVPSSEETEPFETDKCAATPSSPPACRTTARISIRPEAPMPFPSEEEAERLLALPPPPSPLISLLPPSVEEFLARSSLFIPPPVDHREDTPEAELPPRKRLCLIALTLRYKVGESSTAAPRPAVGHRIDYGFIGTLDAKTRRQRAEEVSYKIRDTWVDPREAAEEIAPVTLEGVNTRVTELAAVQEQDTLDIYAVIEDAQDRQTRIFQSVEALIDDRQYHYETARLLDQEALVSREALAHSIRLSSDVHYELQGYRTHAWMQDHRIDAQDSLIAALTAQVSSLQGHLATDLGEIRAL